MNREEQTVQTLAKVRHGARSFATAIFVLIPAVFFWIVFFVFIFGVAGVFFGEKEECNVARIQVQGVLMATDNGLGDMLGLGPVTSADKIIGYIHDAEEDDGIKAIILDVDSPGGTPVAGDEIMDALVSAKKPTVAVVRDRGASAAYWAMSGADYIIASPVSDVGSIGVTMSYLEMASSSENEGSRWIDISSGTFKDAGNPDRVLSEKEQEYFRTQVDGVFEYMLDKISGARQAITRNELKEIADGRAFLGTVGLELKLVDMLGGFSEARDYLADRLSLDESDVVVCEASGYGLGGLLR
jgi:protease-4